MIYNMLRMLFYRLLHWDVGTSTFIVEFTANKIQFYAIDDFVDSRIITC